MSNRYAFLLQRRRTEKERQETVEGFSGINCSKVEDLETYLLKTNLADMPPRILGIALGYSYLRLKITSPAVGHNCEENPDLLSL